MKRCVIIFITLILFFVAFEGGVCALTGETITGGASEHIGMNITVTGGLPSLTILSPKNGTYLVNTSILLNYSVAGQEKTWYNFDHGGNITLISEIYFNISEGGHVLYLFANNTFGTTSKNQSFMVNYTSRFIILDDDFDEENIPDSILKNIRENKKGESTDFFDYTYEELQNLSGIKFHEPNKGKIQFNVGINLTEDENFSDGFINISAYINISFNRIEINHTGLPNFDKPSTLYLYGLTFTNPRILKDGSLCSSTICVFEGYSGGTIKFNATGAGIYTTEETPTIPPVTPPGGPGGVSCTYDWVCSEWYPQPCPPEGIQKRVCVNRGTCTGTEYMPTLTRNCTPAVILPSEPLFDINLKVPLIYKWILPGDEIEADIELINVGNITTIDVAFKYWVVDEGNRLISEEQEMRAVGERDKFKRRFNIPKDAEFGMYKIYVQITYEGKVAMAGDSFEVIDRIKELFGKIILILIILIIIDLIFIVISLIKKEIDRKK